MKPIEFLKEFNLFIKSINLCSELEPNKRKVILKHLESLNLTEWKIKKKDIVDTLYRVKWNLLEKFEFSIQDIEKEEEKYLKKELNQENDIKEINQNINEISKEFDKKKKKLQKSLNSFIVETEIKKVETNKWIKLFEEKKFINKNTSKVHSFHKVIRSAETEFNMLNQKEIIEKEKSLKEFVLTKEKYYMTKKENLIKRKLTFENIDRMFKELTKYKDYIKVKKKVNIKKQEEWYDDLEYSF